MVSAILNAAMGMMGVHGVLNMLLWYCQEMRARHI